MVGFKDPENAVLVSGDPVVEELICKTVTNCTPSVLVERDTDDDHFKVCGASGVPLGFLDISHKKGIGDTYEADQAARILKGAIIVKAILASGQNLTKGAELETAASGRVKVLAAARKVGTVETSVDASAGEKSILVKCTL